MRLAISCSKASRIGCATAWEAPGVARLGGDEFAVIETSLNLPSEAAALATRIGETIRAPFHLDGHEIAADVTFGISLAPNYTSDSSELLRMANVALYEAKNNGRGSYCFFRADMNERVRARIELELHLRRALADGEFELHYQPMSIYETQNRRLEALVRWRNPTGADPACDSFRWRRTPA